MSVGHHMKQSMCYKPAVFCFFESKWSILLTTVYNCRGKCLENYTVSRMVRLLPHREGVVLRMPGWTELLITQCRVRVHLRLTSCEMCVCISPNPRTEILHIHSTWTPQEWLLCTPFMDIYIKEVGRIRHQWLRSECNWYNSNLDKFSTRSFFQDMFVTVFQKLF